MTRAVVAAICVIARLITKLSIFALIHVLTICFEAIFVARLVKIAAIVAILFIERDLVPRPTSAAMASWRVDTYLGTLAIVLQTFVYISTISGIS